MSLFYLQGFEEGSLQSFWTLYDILHIAKPKFVALSLSKEEHDEKYRQVLNHPKFAQHIK